MTIVTNVVNFSVCVRVPVCVCVCVCVCVPMCVCVCVCLSIDLSCLIRLIQFSTVVNLKILDRQDSFLRFAISFCQDRFGISR